MVTRVNYSVHMVAKSEDVARRAGVSRATVSQILNGRGSRFAAETRERVQQAADDLHYEPSAAARTLAKGSSDFVIALIPNTTFGGNLQDIFDKATEALAERGLTLVLRLSTPSTASLDRLITSMKPRAVLSLSPLSAEERALFLSRAVPAFDQSTPEIPIDPNFEIGALQANYLVGRGHQRLAYAHLRDARQDPFGQSREAGVRSVCLEHGLPEPKILGLGIDREDALKAIDSMELPGTAIACYNDDVAIALLGAAHVRGWNVPNDVAIVGMDHTPLSGVTVPPLTTIDVNLILAATGLINAVLLGLGEEPIPAETAFRLTLVEGGTA